MEYIYSPDSTEGYTPEDLDQMRSHLELRNKIHYVDSLVISVEKSLSTYFMGAVHGDVWLLYKQCGQEDSIHH